MLPALQQCDCRGESRTAEAQACSHFKPRDRRRARSSGGNSRSRLRGLSAISVPWSGASKRMPPWQAKLEAHESPPAPSRSPFSWKSHEDEARGAPSDSLGKNCFNYLITLAVCEECIGVWAVCLLPIPAHVRIPDGQKLHCWCAFQG